MKYCIVSDTHQNLEELHAASLLAGDVDLFVHAGDEIGDAKWLAQYMKVPVVGVAGNWDTPSALYPLERTIEGIVPIYLTHGHRLRVKESHDMLVDRTRQKRAKIAIYGHTHVPVAQVIDDILVINPGSLSQPRGGRHRTYVVLTVLEKDSKVVCQAELWTTMGEVLSKVAFETKK
ncbi:metallophosphoesterase family protein [Alicyclobacillus dauci]|uniref:Phosphoesterase n=1 Tax=Alicyclobacillus dauci TaxID=1475485 RepID=A0ABY6Z7R2_9BACL|nr:metallophosphoesterase [Alicyclobacillus dauci]WAH38940.1 metallophosphoesterase [Alicyclobacillus dauci]